MVVVVVVSGVYFATNPRPPLMITAIETIAEDNIITKNLPFREQASYGVSPLLSQAYFHTVDTFSFYTMCMRETIFFQFSFYQIWVVLILDRWFKNFLRDLTTTVFMILWSLYYTVCMRPQLYDHNHICLFINKYHFVVIYILFSKDSDYTKSTFVCSCV